MRVQAAARPKESEPAPVVVREEKKASEFFWQLLFGSTGRMIATGGAAGLLLIFCWFAVTMAGRKESQFDLAGNEYKSPEPVRSRLYSGPSSQPAPPAPTPAPVEKTERLAQPTGSAGNRSLNLQDDLSLSLAPSSPEPAAAAPPASASPLAPANEPALNVSNTLAAAPTLAPPETPAGRLERESTKTTLDEVLAESENSNNVVTKKMTTASADVFYARRALTTKPNQPILQSFALQQIGDQVRITDVDGSVYVGYVEKSDDAAKGSADFPKTRFSSSVAADRDGPLGLNRAKDKELRAAGGGGTGSVPAKTPLAGYAVQTAAGANARTFRLSGTNLSLNQELVFHGQLILQGAATNAAFGGTAASPGGAQVIGRVIIGATNQMNINARAVR